MKTKSTGYSMVFESEYHTTKRWESVPDPKKLNNFVDC